MDSFFDVLINQCTDGTLLIIEESVSKKFVQFVKETDSKRMLPHLHFGFPDAPWSREFLEEVKKVLSQDGFDITHNNTSDVQGMSFLDIDLVDEPEALICKGEKITQLCLGAMELNEKNLLTVHFKGALKRRGKIGKCGKWRKMGSE